MLINVRHRVARFHKALRAAKVELFFSRLKPRPQDTLLDIGGSTGLASEYERLHSYFSTVWLLGIEATPADWGRVKVVRGDARNLEFPDKSVDWVFSNAVIEHVGDLAEQQRMASEVRRVARKGYFITTPNRWFPIDPHTYLPVSHWLPHSVSLRVRQALFPREVDLTYRLLGRHEMLRLFPEASILTFSFGTSIIATFLAPDANA